jgi:hypothetical protein
MSGKAHDPPEAIEAYLATLLDYLVSRDLGEGDVRRHHLQLLRKVCRAAQHGRLPDAMRSRYRGDLRHVRAQVAAARKAGDAIPAIVVEEIERASARPPPRPPVR